MVKNKIIPRERNFSNSIGWETAANVSLKEMHKGYGEIKYSTTKWGFRVFGDINTNKTKIFVIGDSITQAQTVSDGHAYYDYLKRKNNNIEVFAYGTGGYGSLQEYMILDRYFDVIKPDIIVWQFSCNDIINNDHELESASLINNNHMVRPYYKHDHIEWLYPTQNRGLIYKIVQSSYLLRLLDISLKALRAEHVGSIEDKLSDDHPLFKKSLITTSDILGMVRKKAGNIPIVAFSADNKKWIGNAFLDICSTYAMHFIPVIPEAIQAAKGSGVIVDGSPYNPHWNNIGHSIVGEIILDYLIETKLLNND